MQCRLGGAAVPLVIETSVTCHTWLNCTTIIPCYIITATVQYQRRSKEHQKLGSSGSECQRRPGPGHWETGSHHYTRYDPKGLHVLFSGRDTKTRKQFLQMISLADERAPLNKNDTRPFQLYCPPQFMLSKSHYSIGTES